MGMAWEDLEVLAYRPRPEDLLPEAFIWDANPSQLRLDRSPLFRISHHPIAVPEVRLHSPLAAESCCARLKRRDLR
jgi:hypothetical protein